MEYQQTTCSVCGEDGTFFFFDKPETKYCFKCKKNEIRHRKRKKRNNEYGRER